MPSRRSYLAALAAALGGCTAGPARDATTTGMTGTTGTTTATPGTTTSTTAATTLTSGDVERLPAADPALAWAVELPARATTAPTVDSRRGRVYVGTSRDPVSSGTPTATTTAGEDAPGAVFGLSAADGGLDWRASTAAPVVERPLVHGGRVHAVAGYSTGFTGEAQRVLAYAADGSRRWATDPRDEFLSLVGAHDGSLFVGTHDDALSVEGETLFALAADGGVSWEKDAGDAMGGTVADGRLLYRAGMQALVAYDPADGTETWRVDGDPLGNPDMDIAAFDGRCFTQAAVETEEGYPLVAHSTADGSEQWRYAAAPGSGENFVPTGVTALAGGEGDPALVGTEYDGTVFALSGDGREEWTFAADAGTHSGPVAGDAVYVGDSEGTVYALDSTDGSERWRATLPDFASTRALSAGVLAWSAGEGETVVASFRPGGSERWRYTTPKDLTRPAVAGDRAYAAAEDGTVLAFAGDG